MLSRLIDNLNQKSLTFTASSIFHFAAIFCSLNTIGLVLAFFNVLVFFVKLYRFHAFMIYNPDKKIHAYLQDPNIQRGALVVSCLSLFLELFGQIFI